MPEDELAGKKAGVAEQGTFDETLGEKVYLLRKKGRVTHTECKEVAYI